MIDFNVPLYIGKETDYMKEAIENKKICGDGMFTKKCNQWIEEKTGTKKALLTTSCTHATELAALLADIKEGDEVIMPAYTFVSTADAFVLRGAKAVFVDIRPDTMNIDENLIEDAITEKTRAIVPVHYAGVSCEMDKIMEIAKKHNLLVIEDAAQGIMSEYKGKALGTIGDYGCFSFHETKNYSMGEGGALLIRDEENVENAENIVKKKKAGQSEATLAYKIPARTAEQTSEDSENKGCGEKQTLGPVSGMKTAMDGDICFRDVSFGYSPDHPVLKNINFTIPSGSTFAILGTTGSGKSTLVHLLNRLYDLPEDCGSITIGGTDIRDIDRQYLRQNIGMVLQEPFLFSRTIRENIGITKEKLLDEEIRHAAEIACVDESILHFADGYDTIVGERGVTLSGGQKQRVAIARMLMKEAPILVFDDSLSAVDTETDNKIRKELKKEMEKATVIMISHRITSLMQADCIIVMDKGEIQQMGTHEELIHQEGPYKDIYEIQMNSDIRLMEGGAVCE